MTTHGLFTLTLVALATLLLAGCPKSPSPEDAAALPDIPIEDAAAPGADAGPSPAAGDAAEGSAQTEDAAPEVQRSATGLKWEVLREGEGEPAQAGDQVSVHYTGRLEDGTKFDSSLDRNEPFSFLLGRGQVIPGWDEGVAGMKPGEQRRLTVPPALGYGELGTPGGPIPPNATLIFEVEFLGVQ